nr:MAG TPA_asm: hypothetical protein [Caudoviricetes sp.]
MTYYGSCNLSEGHLFQTRCKDKHFILYLQAF